MGKARLAQVGQGNPKVVAHPGFSRFPPCKFALKTEKAAAEYGAIGRLIWNAGRLSQDMHLTLSTWAILFDQIEQIEASGRTPRASWFKNLQDAQRRLKLDDLDQPISAPAEAPINRFARFGLTRRR